MKTNLKVLVIGASFFNYAEAAQEAFNANGCEAFLYEVSAKWPFPFVEKVYWRFWRLLWGNSRLYSTPRFALARDNKRIIQIYHQVRPDVVLVFRGDTIFPEVLSEMSEAIRIVWIYDSINRLPQLVKTLKFYDKIYCFEHNDISFLADRGISAQFLPLCADSQIYYPKEMDKDIDVSFVGNLSKERIKLIKDIVKAYPNLRYEIYGQYIGKLQLIKRIKYYWKKEYRIFRNEEIPPKKVNEVYARSKICLNILHEQSQYGANPRFYEIMASRAFQLVNGNPYIEKEFKGDVPVFHTEEELISMIAYFLSHERAREAYAIQGYNKVCMYHTFYHRIRTILNELIEKRQANED